MPDVYCPTCGEPTDSHHHLYDEPYEHHFIPRDQDWSAEDTEHVVRHGVGPGIAFQKNKPGVMTREYRNRLTQAGYVFTGDSVISYVACPFCTPEQRAKAAMHSEDNIIRKIVGQEALHDLDGALGLMEDFSLFREV